MEDEAATGTAKDTHVPKLPRTVLPDDQQAPPGGDLDLISRLPDEILGTIISILPAKDAARTQALSCRWLPLWRSHMAPLNLVADNTLSNYQSRVKVISKILSDHPGPARRFSAHVFFLSDVLDEIDGWFCSESLAGVEEFEITNLLRMNRYTLPAHALTGFAPTLRVLRLDSCILLDMVTPPSFPHLKELIMYNISISEDSLQSMISGCAVLETVALHRMRFGRLCISSPTLRTISFYALPSKGAIVSQELIIEDAPCLERLLPILPNEIPTTIRVIRAPKLHTLGFLSKDISTLHLGTTVFEKMTAVRLTTKIYTMKILALHCSGDNVDAVVDFLNCFICLEKLYVILQPGEDSNNFLKYDPLAPIECLELSLQKVVLKNYDSDTRSFIDFAKFFILNAQVLRKMEIEVPYKTSDEWMRYRRTQLQVENRASRDAQIELRSDIYVRTIDSMHTHDLSIADPFENSLCGIQEIC
ncbi:unnamed protein product [Alopecurus aequalis]